MGSNDQNHRKPRLKSPWLVRYQNEESGEHEVANLRNLSETGLMFEAPSPFPENTEFSMQLLLPFHAEPIVVKAKVARCARPKDAMNRYHIGVNFSEINPEHKTLIKDHIQEIADSDLGEDFIQS